MKIVLKPGGVAVIVLGITALAVMAARNRMHIRPEGQTLHAPFAQVLSPSLLQNGEMEGQYRPVAQLPTLQNAVIRGSVAPSWDDNSEWATVVVRYAEDTDSPHEGKSCQRIEIGHPRTPKKTAVATAMQFKQGIELTGKKRYRFAFWAKASRETPATIALRGSREPYASFGEKPLAVTMQWQRYEVDAAIPTTQFVFAMLATQEADVTLWFDDATLTVAP